jgi:DNA-binding MarR family transcriptional regulator
MHGTSEQKKRLKGLEQAESCVCFNLRRTTRAVTQYYNAGLQPSGLLATQFSLLAALAAQDGGTPISTLASTLSMDRTTLARNLQPLRRGRLIHIASDAHDRRIQRVSITHEGLDRLADALPLWRQAQHHVLEQYGMERWQALLGSLGVISRSVGA